MRGNAVGDELR